MQNYEDLKSYIKQYRNVIVAFSGGIDSYFVLKASLDTLGKDNVLAVTGDSPTLKESEKQQTAKLAKNIGVNYKVILTEEMQNPDYYNNPANRCFFCKDELFNKLETLRSELNYDVIFDGTNFDDMSDYRPGYKAGRKHNVISPLADLKFTKDSIREISRALGLEIWSKPSSPCLSSRIPYGQIVTIEKLSLIEQAEEILKQFGFRDFRVRHFEFSSDGNGKKMKIAKIDLSDREIENILDEKLISRINKMLKNLGYDFVTLDMGGLRTGSLNPERSRRVN
ncbi:MAG: ATP-dependent sacrificial sulfur transferase LarE [Ignavibacteria bacterium]